MKDHSDNVTLDAFSQFREQGKSRQQCRDCSKRRLAAFNAVKEAGIDTDLHIDRYEDWFRATDGYECVFEGWCCCKDNAEAQAYEEMLREHRIRNGTEDNKPKRKVFRAFPAMGPGKHQCKECGLIIATKHKDCYCRSTLFEEYKKVQPVE